MSDLALEPEASAALTQSLADAGPAAGRPFTTEAGRWNAGVLHAEELLRSGLDHAPLAPSLAEAGAVLPSGQPYRSAIDRAARRLVASWLSGVLIGDLDPGASFLDAEAWFSGSAVTSSALPLDCARHAHAVLEALVRSDRAVAMLPYALDPTPHEYRRDVVNKGSAGRSRAERKASGSFFTPADVAEHIVDLALSSITVGTSQLRVLDPAAGTGVFARSAFRGLIRRGVSPASAITSLFGVDVDERCVDMAAFVLLVDYARSDGPVKAVAHETWSRIRDNFVAADTLTVLHGTGTADTLFGREPSSIEWLDGPFDVIVANPPYARLGARGDLSELAARFCALDGATAATDVFPAFVEILCSQLAPGGAGSMVVPMSIGYSTAQPIHRLRQAATAARGEWSFEFFDRTPDALFGDDVKQRTAIVTRRAVDSYAITTSPVMRWTSRNRPDLFDRVPHVNLDGYDISRGVPKLASADQAEALATLRALPETIEHSLRYASRVVPPIDEDDGATVYVAGTAYNWLNVYRTGRSVSGEVGKPTASPLLALGAATPAAADALYALLSSRVAYWLWRVETDVFHVTSGWVRQLPLTPSAFEARDADTLAALGRDLWTAIADHPVVSLNGGITTLSYCPHSEPSLLDEIDEQILARFDLQPAFGLELAAFVRDLTVAGRNSDAEHGLRRALASWRES